MSNCSRGFTLIELVMVIVIAGILATVAGPRFFTPSVFTQRAYADDVAAALRLAQKTAVRSDCPTRVALTSGSYVVPQQAAAGNTCNQLRHHLEHPVTGLDGVAAAGQRALRHHGEPHGQLRVRRQRRLVESGVDAHGRRRHHHHRRRHRLRAGAMTCSASAASR